MATTRAFEVVVWGATGFTGSLVAQYLARLPNVRWAVAGRSRSKLDKVVEGLEGVVSAPAVVECSVQDARKLGELAASTQVVLSTAGPFAKIGTPVVEACLANGTDYCDITGEVAWVRRMMDAHEAEAIEKQIILSSCCGFDSVPSDLGTLYGALKLKERFGFDVPVGAARAYCVMSGGLSGGTLASGINMEKDPELARMMRDPFLLGGIPRGGPRPEDADVVDAAFDEHMGAWTAPFGMATINTRIVRRSNMLLGYGGDAFSYREVSLVPNESVARKLARGAPPAEKREEMVKAGRLPAPGQGPSPEMRANSFFRTYVRVEAANDPSKAVLVCVSGGDPGYDETAKMVAESALCLARQRDVLPRKGGFLTPAAAMGTHLIERLSAAGMRFEHVAAPPASKL